MLNTIFEVVINDNIKIKAIIRQYQLCPCNYFILFFRLFDFIIYLFFLFILDTNQPLAVNFLRYKPGTILKIPIKIINEDDNIDIKRGAFIFVINRFFFFFFSLHHHFSYFS